MNDAQFFVLCALLLALIFVAGCADNSPRYIEHKDAASVQAAYERYTGESDDRIGGFAAQRGETCEIHYRRDAPNVELCIRHELMHCWLGAWHPGEEIQDC